MQQEKKNGLRKSIFRPAHDVFMNKPSDLHRGGVPPNHCIILQPEIGQRVSSHIPFPENMRTNESKIFKHR